MKKKYISVLMAFVFILGLFPANSVFANLQNPVPSISIINNTLSDPNGTDYDITLRWLEPEVSIKPDTSSVTYLGVNGGYELHRAEGYRIYYKNASLGENYTNYFQELDYTEVISRFRIQLDPGSFYVFKVDPFHVGSNEPNNGIAHRVNIPGSDVPAPAEAKLDGAAPEALYLTDIRVEASGSGNQLTVTWDNPLYYGQELISEYIIYYAPDIPADSAIPEVNTKHVSKDNAALERINGNKQLRYTFTDDDLKPGTPYSLKVVPVISTTILINNKPYPVNHSPREYRRNNVYIKPALWVDPFGSEQVKLTWNSLSTFTAGRITDVIIKKSVMAPEDFKEIDRVQGSSAKTTNFSLDARPEKDTKYMITIVYIDDSTGEIYEMDSEIAIFYTSFEDYLPYRPTILSLDPSKAAPYSVNMKWLAFLREIYDAENEAGDPKYGNMYIDNNITYDIWVTDDISNLNDAALTPLITDLDAAALPLTPYEPPENPEIIRPAYSATVTQYMTKDENGNYTTQSMVENKVYYFKIVATRKASEDMPVRKSLEALASVYIPPSGDISATPVMLSSPPLRIKKDENGAEQITDTSIAIEWDAKWAEAYDGLTNRWYSHLGVRDGKPVFGDKSLTNLLEGISPDQANLKEALAAALTGAGVDENEAGLIATRVMDLTNAKYRIHVVKYESMISSGITSYEQYMSDVLLDYPPGAENADGSKWNTVWNGITPLESGQTLYYVAEGLTPNTPYVIFLRPYTINASYYPAFVTGTTLEARPDLPIVPTTPVIEVIPEETTDMSVTVRFTYTESLTYTLYYSELLSDYPGQGTAIPWETLRTGGAVKKAVNKATGREETYMYYTITDLFPETVYYFWVSATSAAASVTKISNPTSETTKELAPPNPPRGFGLASNNSLDVYNKTNETNIQRIGADYITYEWMRDSKDTGNVPASFAEGSAEALLSELLPVYYMAKFNDLIPNREYYARAKTILTVTKGQDGIERSYSYTVQVSPDANFTDVVEITIPPLEADPDSANTLRKESGWTNTITIKTNTSPDEYDGDKNDKHYPLPSQDFEMLYNPGTKTLTYRFRSNQKDAKGNNDNQVDQRFISSLRAGGVFVYDIDLSSYGSNEVKVREVIMPYSIYKAFNERKISLKIISNAMSVTIKPGSFNTAEVNSLRDFGASSSVKLTVTEDVTAPGLSSAESYAAVPQKVSLAITTPTRTLNLTNTGTDMDISLKLDHRYSVMDANVGVYVFDANTGGWSRLNSDYKNYTGAMYVSSRKLANFAAIAKTAPMLFDADEQITNSVYNVTTKLDIRDLTSLDPNDPIHASQFNLLLLAVSKGRLSVNINDTMSDEDISSLGKAGILISGSTVPREAGINALVRLYENKTKPVRSYPTANESYFPDISAVSSQYLTSMLKAEEIGMLDRFETLDPHKDMTFADVFYILDIIIADAGL